MAKPDQSNPGKLKELLADSRGGFTLLSAITALSSNNVPATHAKRIFQELTKCGMSAKGFALRETRHLPQLIHENETIGGVVYGKSDEGLVMLVATDLRVIYLDVKPLFVKSDDVKYQAVSDINFEWIGFSGTITLHTPSRAYKVRTLNYKAAKIFKEYLEKRCIEQANHIAQTNNAAIGS